MLKVGRRSQGEKINRRGGGFKEKKKVLSYLMSQPHSNDKEVWFSLACDLCTAVYNTISIQSQPIINVQQGQNSTKRERERERCVWSVCGCVSLNLSPLHTPQPCVRVSTRAEAESTGVRELEAGPVDMEEEPTGGGTDRATGRVSQCCWTSNGNI